MDSSDADQRQPHQRDPPQPVTVKQLEATTGVLVFKLNSETFDEDGSYEKIRKERGYNYEDRLTISRETLPDYDNKLKNFYTEHLHTDEEVRLIVEGSGYFDVRDNNDEWIRVACGPGDLLVLPAGIYHRFTLDENNYVKVRRLFIGDPVWTAHNRPAEHFPERQKYIERLKSQ